MAIRKRFTKPKKLLYHQRFGSFKNPPWDRSKDSLTLQGYYNQGVCPVRVTSENFKGAPFKKLLQTLQEPIQYHAYRSSVYIGLLHFRHYFYTQYLSIGMWVREYPILCGNEYALKDGKILTKAQHDIFSGWTYIGEMEPARLTLRDHDPYTVFRSPEEMRLEDRAHEELIEAFRQRYSGWNGRYEFIY